MREGGAAGRVEGETGRSGSGEVVEDGFMLGNPFFFIFRQNRNDGNFVFMT